MANFSRSFSVLVAGSMLVACSDESESVADEAPLGSLHSALAFAGDTHDVASMYYRVIAADADCADPQSETLDEANPGLETEAMPAWIDPNAGPNHAFSDALFVLQPGEYKVCVSPLTADGAASAVCAPTEGLFAVQAEQTTEGVLYSQCDGDPSGGLDVIAALNDPPHIDDLDIAESKFIQTCETATITVTASDPNGDPLNYAFEVTDTPAGAQADVAGQGNSAVFSSDSVGPHEVTVTVDDGIGGTATLSFPIHVSECLIVAGVQQDVPEEDVLARGFRRCWMTAYNDAGHPVPEILEECDGEYLMMACRPLGDANLRIAAEGLADEVLLDVGDDAQASHDHNDVQWYFSPNRSWGFAPVGAAINRNSCDADADQRGQKLCWHMEVPGAQPNEVAGGWNCGADTFLQNGDGADFERILYTR